MFRAELVKLKRSAVWAIAPLLPLMAVITGTVNTAANIEVLDSGWASLTSQITLFYSLLFYSVGIALLTATVWRTEHRGTNWNLLLTNTRHPIALVLAKIAAILVPVAFMQLVLVGGTLIAGLVVLDLDGALPWGFVISGGLAVLVALPLIAAQSLLSMLLRSFAAPVALSLLGCVAGIAAVLKESLRPLGYLIPQALNTNVLTLGSSALTTSGGLSVANVVPLLAAALVLLGIFVWASVRAITSFKLA